MKVRCGVGLLAGLWLCSCATGSTQGKGLTARQTLELIAAGVELTAASVSGTIHLGRGVVGAVVGDQVCQTVETTYPTDGGRFVVARGGCTHEEDADGNLLIRVAGAGSESRYLGLVAFDYRVSAEARFVRALHGRVLYFVPTAASVDHPVVSNTNLLAGVAERLGVLDQKIRTELSERILKPRTYFIDEKCTVTGWVPAGEKPKSCDKDGLVLALGGTFEPLPSAPLGWERVAGMRLGVAQREIQSDVELAVRGAGRIRKVVSERREAAVVQNQEPVAEVPVQPSPSTEEPPASTEPARVEMVARQAESPPDDASSPPPPPPPPPPPAPPPTPPQEPVAGSTRRVPLGVVAVSPARPSIDVQDELRRGKNARAAKNYSEAAVHYRAVVDEFPEHAEAWFALGEVSKSGGDLETAIHAYEKFTRLNPEDPAGYFGLARSYELARETRGAIVSYERYLELEQRGSERRWVEKAKRALQELRANDAD